MTPYYIWGTLALLAAGFAVGGLFLHLVQQRGEDSVVSSPLMPDPLSSLQPPARDVLLAPEPELAADLINCVTSYARWASEIRGGAERPSVRTAGNVPPILCP